MPDTQRTTKREIEQLVNLTELEKALSQNSDDVLGVLKKAVTEINDGLKTLYQNGMNVDEIVFGRAQLVDHLLVTVLKHLFRDVKQKLSLIAVGGYGSGELHPASDVDLMLLLHEEEDEQTKDTL